MDILIDIECKRCGLKFSQGFGEMPHGRTLKCPFCSNAGLTLKKQMPHEGKDIHAPFEHYERYRAVEVKAKA